MSKIIKTGSDSRAKLLNGATQLAEDVVTTLGPNGRNVKNDSKSHKRNVD